MTETDEMKREIVTNAVRWAANMIVEVTGNYGSVLNEKEREALKFAARALTVDFPGAKRE